jgi:hypothetical protein
VSREISFGKIADSKIYKAAWGQHSAKIIGDVKSDDEKTSIEYFESKFTDLAKKVSILETTIQESENKGSYLMKLVHLQNIIVDHEGLGDYAQLDGKLTELESSLKDIIQSNRVRNSEIKKSQIEELRNAVKEINWKESTEAVHEIKSRWIKTGNPLESEQEELETSFWKEIEDFFERKRIFYEDKRRLQKIYKETYEYLVKEATHVPSLFGKAKYDKIDELKERWKDVGNIAKEEYDPLLRNFNFKLKAKAPIKEPQVNIGSIVKDLELMSTGKKRLDFRQLDQHKKTLKNFRPFDQSLKLIKQEALDQTQVLMERDFIDKLARKRFKEFDRSDAEKKKTIRIGILRELISRDKSDLETFEENSAKFSSRAGDANDLIQRKLNQQKNKIEVKERLMKILKE